MHEEEKKKRLKEIDGFTQEYLLHRAQGNIKQYMNSLEQLLLEIIPFIDGVEIKEKVTIVSDGRNGKNELDL